MLPHQTNALNVLIVPINVYNVLISYIQLINVCACMTSVWFEDTASLYWKAGYEIKEYMGI